LPLRFHLYLNDCSCNSIQHVEIKQSGITLNSSTETGKQFQLKHRKPRNLFSYL